MKLDEPYLTPGTYISGGNFLREDSEIIVPKGKYFVSETTAVIALIRGSLDRYRKRILSEKHSCDIGRFPKLV